MVLVQHFIPTHCSARRAGSMVLGGFCISPSRFYLQQCHIFIVVLFHFSVTSHHYIHHTNIRSSIVKVRCQATSDMNKKEKLVTTYCPNRILTNMIRTKM